MGQGPGLWPDLAKALIPMMEAYADTARAMQDVTLPATLPVVDIVAERSWNETPAEGEAMRAAHKAFVAESPNRRSVLASGSGHNVMQDRPDVVVEAIKNALLWRTSGLRPRRRRDTGARSGPGPDCPVA